MNIISTIHTKEVRDKVKRVCQRRTKIELPSSPYSIFRQSSNKYDRINDKLQKNYWSTVGALLYVTMYRGTDISNMVQGYSKMMGGTKMDEYISLLQSI